MEHAISLVRKGDYAVVSIEVNGQWIEIIREYLDAPFSHIIEPTGIKEKINRGK